MKQTGQKAEIFDQNTIFDKYAVRIMETCAANAFIDVSQFPDPFFRLNATTLKASGYLQTPHLNKEIFELTPLGQKAISDGG